MVAFHFLKQSRIIATLIFLTVDYKKSVYKSRPLRCRVFPIHYGNEIKCFRHFWWAIFSPLCEFSHEFRASLHMFLDGTQNICNHWNYKAYLSLHGFVEPVPKEQFLGRDKFSLCFFENAQMFFRMSRSATENYVNSQLAWNFFSLK